MRVPVALTLGAGALLTAWPWAQGAASAAAMGASGATGIQDLHHDLRGILLVGAFWTLARIVSVASHAAACSTLADSKPHLVPVSEFVARILRVGVLLVGTITLLGEFGFPVASLLAGVGVGGIAVALAAQKTVENLFGSISILADAPFRVGDRVSFDGVTGAVLSVGLRSTRLRTDDQRLIVMPNGKLADMRIENLSTFNRPLTMPAPDATSPSEAKSHKPY